MLKPHRLPLSGVGARALSLRRESVVKGGQITTIAALAAMVIVLAGCSQKPSGTDVVLTAAQLEVVATVEQFFGHLEGGHSQAAAALTDLATDPASPEGLYLRDEVYSKFTARPELTEVTDIRVQDDHAVAQVTYQIGEVEHSQDIDLTQTGGTQGAANYQINLEQYRVITFDNGLEIPMGTGWLPFLPNGTSYSIAGQEENFIFDQAIGAENLPVAFGGEYELVVMLAGTDMEPLKFVVHTATFFGLQDNGSDDPQWVELMELGEGELGEGAE